MPRELSGPRAVAHAVLSRVEETDAFADVALAHALERERLSPADAALATHLVYGTLAWQGRLDHHLAAWVRRPLPSLDRAVRIALRLGLFQVLFTRVPAYAAVDASVALARAGSGTGGAGLVNAVLRRAAAAVPDGLPLPPPSDPIARWAVEHSHPRWLVERWATELGPETLPAVLAANNQPGTVALRVNRTATGRAALATALAEHGVTVATSRFAPDGLDVRDGAARIVSTPPFRDGACTFQGEASQLVVELLDPQPGEYVLDACAAPGGKTTAIAERVGPAGRVVALDVHRTGVRRVRELSARLGVEVAAVVADARHPPLAGAFDRILVDAPCSGLGTLRRHPELRWRRTAADIPRLAALQLEILAGVVALLRPGGTLVYAVCTRTHDETDAVVAHLRAAHPRLAPVDAAGVLPPEVVADGALRTLPHPHDLDGFFAIRLRLDSA